MSETVIIQNQEIKVTIKSDTVKISFLQTNTVTSSGGGSGVWGAITGTLSDQTDLATALGLKADKTQTINGIVFSGNITVPNTILYKGTGKYYSNAINQNVRTTMSVANAAMRAYPFIVPKTIIIDQIISEVTTLVGGTEYRIGLYTDNGSLYPDALVANSDTGAYSSASTGVKTGTPSSNITLTPGLYWIVTNANGAPTLRGLMPTSVAPVLGEVSTMGASGNQTAYAVSSTYGALPATFPVGATILGNVSIVLVNFRMV